MHPPGRADAPGHADPAAVDGPAESVTSRLVTRLLRLVTDGSLRVLSLDVFDTLLWRRVPRPVELFAVVAHRLRSEGLLAEWVTDSAFVGLRARVEGLARDARGPLGPEVSLREIWLAMPPEPFSDVPVDILMGVEMQVEREFTVVDLDTRRLVDAARHAGLPLVLVSDTYFDDEQLRYLLDRPQLELPPGTRIFRSQEYGTAKGDGLWPAVLTALGVAPDEIVHIGDNPVADDEVPARHGIRTVHYERVDEEFARVLERERTTPTALSTAGTLVDPEHGDAGLTTMRARAVGLAGRDGRRTDVARRFGAGVLGPVLTGFAEWVARSCAARRVRTAWCPMREGELLAALVNDAARAHGLEVEARPLWLSRHVVWLATVDELDADSVADMIRRSYGATVRSLLSTLALRPGDVPSLAPHLDRVLDDQEMVDRVAAALVEAPHLRHRLAVTATGKRRRLVRALRDAGALDEPEMVLVDLGWGATIQLQLAAALDKAGVDVVPSGMYVATDFRSLRLLARGLRVEGYLGAAGRPAPLVESLARSPEALEMSVNALCGSLLDFSEDGTPILGPTVGTEDQHAERRAVQTGIVDFQRRWHAYRATDRDWPSLLIPSARDHLGEVLRAAICAPTEQEASLFALWSHEDNLGSDHAARLVPDDLEGVLPYLSPNDLADLGMRDAFWPQLLAPGDAGLAAAARALAAGAIDADAFEAAEPSRARLMVHTVDDRWSPGSEHQVRINHHGLSFARLALEPRAADDAPRSTPHVLDVSVELTGRPAVVRVDRVIVSLRTVDGVEQEHRWETPADLAGLHLADAAWLGGNLVELRSATSAVVLPLAARAGAPVVHARVTVAFAMLPQSPSGLSPVTRGAPTTARMSGRLLAEFRRGGVRGVASGATRLALRRVVDRG
ncbi:HAD family hydrolase [Actinomycetospora sp. NBRC 106375]|uniref:HAD family hydrolase n=1 Tax=Actinomycetospora sp. NBRC 106375 TaxID=3032207 RepID=UPI00332B8358